ncbi:MAG: hypothetical protein A2X61_04665 [Ignavibacteria bacterium GWB2_35_12]|nr:MAG: hypothetical protein A2X61_04665 [Ignavibacteria bacterium GWB2_35_12]OGU88940.1 MAG: hypothetical protein A2220_06675 [Ignavibacteria bacterium RIFOXYA2_FULL_35_10]OGV24604.1 MAG: hypothetical protein A2475_09280 [Ignavibacteria bacterium RIFOXYC2_FULL_35_21]
MADRLVRFIRKSLFSEIIALCNPEENWSPRQKDDAIQDIENGEHSYYIPWGEKRIEIRVAEGINGKYLSADQENLVMQSLEQVRMN